MSKGLDLICQAAMELDDLLNQKGIKNLNGVGIVLEDHGIYEIQVSYHGQIDEAVLASLPQIFKGYKVSYVEEPPPQFA